MHVGLGPKYRLIEINCVHFGRGVHSMLPTRQLASLKKWREGADVENSPV